MRQTQAPYRYFSPAEAKSSIIISNTYGGRMLLGDNSAPMETFSQDAIRLIHPAESLWAHFISPYYCRDVVDLNGDPELIRDKSGRYRTSAVPSLGWPRKPKKDHVSRVTILSRLNQYYWPYYKAIEVESKKQRKRAGLSTTVLVEVVVLPQAQRKNCVEISYIADSSKVDHAPALMKNTFEKLGEIPTETKSVYEGHLLRYFHENYKGVFRCLRLGVSENLALDPLVVNSLGDNRARRALREVFAILMSLHV